MAEVGTMRTNYLQDNEKDWNLNQNFSNLITEVVKAVNDSAQIGDLHSWWNNLRILFRNVVAHEKFTEEVQMKVQELFEKSKRSLKKVPPFGVSIVKESEEMKVAKIKATKCLDSINIMLIGEMYKAGLIFPVTKKRDVKYSSLELN